MGEFGTFILDETIPYITSSPTVFFGLAGIILLYFGYLYNDPKIERPSERIYDSLHGLIFLFGMLSLSLLVIIFSQSQRFIDLKIQNNIILTVIKILTINYAYWLMYFAALKSNRYRDSFTYFETNYILNYLKIEPDGKLDLQKLSFISIKKWLKLHCIQKVWILVYGVLFEWLSSFLLLLLLAAIFLSNTSIPMGIFIFAYAFFALSSYAVYKGTGGGLYRYAEVYLKESGKIENGRLLAINKDFIRLLKNKYDKKYYLQIIPVMNIEKIELRTLEEILAALEKEKK